MVFSNSLIDWYLHNKRDLPWRKTKDPYKIWLSEIILQQTRVAQGLPYYSAFLKEFPTIVDLANAEEEKVLKIWQGLGYYSRARNLHATAKIIVDKYNGIFPSNYKKILELKGVGEYTAAAIASFAFDLPVAVVDGNVFRVLARFLGINDDISVASVKKIFQDKAQELLPNKKAAIFNQAIMEFGAIQCVPVAPVCGICVMNEQCVAYLSGRVGLLPVKTKRIKITTRYMAFLVMRDVRGAFLVEKRDKKGIWQNLYQFPLMEFAEKKDIKDVVTHIEKEYESCRIILKSDNWISHKLSHQHLKILFFELQFNNSFNEGIRVEQLMELPFPIILRNFINENYLASTKNSIFDI